LLWLIKVRRWQNKGHAVHMPATLPSLSLITLSHKILVQYTLLAMLIITMHGLGSREAGIGQATRAQDHASARPGMPVGVITTPWTRQSVAMPHRLSTSLHPYLCVEQRLPLL
jgi:hypothetical protein